MAPTLPLAHMRQVFNLFKEVRLECIDATSTGNLGKTGSKVALPAEKIRRLAKLVREMKVEKWAVTSTEVSEVPNSTLVAVAGVGKDLEDMFIALGQVDVQKTCCGIGETGCAQISNVEAGLWLACMHLDAAAGCGPLPEIGQGMGDCAVLKFVSHVIRSFFASTGEVRMRSYRSRGRGNPSDFGSAVRPVVDAVAALWQSAHYAIAAASYAASPLARCVLPLAVRCAVGVRPHNEDRGTSEPMSAVTAGAINLLTAAFGQGDESLQAMAVEELSSCHGLVHTASCFASDGSGTDAPQATKGPGNMRLSAQTSVMLQAVSAACFPANLGGVQADLTAKELQSIAAARRAKAEDRAAALVQGTLRRCLLGAGKESQEWVRMEAMTHELLDSCKDPHWPAAPLLLLSLTKGLAAVVGASRSVDMSWTCREFAARLLGMIATELCRQGAAAVIATDFQKVQRWWKTWQQSSRSDAKGRRRRRPVTSDSDSESSLGDADLEVQRLLVHFLEAAPCSAQVLWAPATKERKEKGFSHQPVLSADHIAWSSAFLLGSWAAKPTKQGTPTMTGPTARLARTKGRHTSSKRAVAALRSAGDEVDKECGAMVNWTLTAWSACGSAKKLAACTDRRTDPQRDAVSPEAFRLYQRQFKGSDSELGRARRVALETLLAQLESSPLVFVRRQAVLGLAGACSADATLVTSRCIGEAIKLGLSDDSALVRSAVVDFIGHFVNTKVAGTEHSSALCAAVRVRLGDVASGVRRSAFRVVCDALCPEDPGLMANALDLMQRIQHETPQIRELVLSALERALLSRPVTAQELNCLAACAAHPSIRDAGLRDLLKAHRGARDFKVFAQSMQTLARLSCESVKAQGETEKTHMCLILEQIALEYPPALFEHITEVQGWLQVEVETATSRQVLLAEHACRILADMLPDWAAQINVSERKLRGYALQGMLVPLLTAHTRRALEPSVLTRGSLECLCVVAKHVTADPKELLGLVGRSFHHLSEMVGTRTTLDNAGQWLLCRHAWLLGTALEFVDVDELASTMHGHEACALRGRTAATVADILSALCLRGPATLRPWLMPPLGFLLRRHIELLQVSPAVVEVFCNGLGSDKGMCFRTLTLEVLDLLLSSYRRTAEAGGPPSGVQDEVSAKMVLAPKVSEAVQCLSTLQPQVLEALAQADAASIAHHALKVIVSLNTLGVLHPSAALPGLIASSMAGFQQLADPTRNLIFKLTEAAPQLLLSRLGTGLREAAVRLKPRTTEAGRLLVEAWRFSALSDACGVLFESRRLRELFLDAVLAEVIALANSCDDSETQLERAELLLGLLARLPYKSEFEIVRLLKCAVQFLMLRALPLLCEPSASNSEPCSLGICAVSLLLHVLCQHLCTADEIKRLLTEREVDSMLQPGFSRRLATTENFVPMFRELWAAAGNHDVLLTVLESHIPLDSPLLTVGTAQQYCAKQKAKGRCTARGQKRKSGGQPVKSEVGLTSGDDEGGVEASALPPKRRAAGKGKRAR